MPTDEPTQPQKPVPVSSPLSMREFTEVLIKHYGLHEGYYDLFAEFQIGAGAVGPNPESLTLGAVIGLQKIGLIGSKTITSLSVNAAEINPVKAARGAKKKATST